MPVDQAGAYAPNCRNKFRTSLLKIQAAAIVYIRICAILKIGTSCRL